MNKLPFSEINRQPSALNTSATTAGVPSQLVSLAENKPNFDGVTIESMRGNPLYEHCDDIDKTGLAQKALVDAAKKVKSKSKMIRALNDHAQKQRIPSAK